MICQDHIKEMEIDFFFKTEKITTRLYFVMQSAYFLYFRSGTMSKNKLRLKKVCISHCQISKIGCYN